MKKLLLLLLIAVMGSCATGYVKISPETIGYASSNEQNGLKIEYKYDVLQKKYAKKEGRKGIKLISVKITNTSGQGVILGKDAILKNGVGTEIPLLNNEQIYKPLKQNLATYFLYLLLTPVKLFQTTENNGVVEQEEIFPIGYILGPGITAINVITAGNGNSKFKEELENYNLLHKTIEPGATVHGLIGIRTNTFENLKVVLKE